MDWIHLRCIDDLAYVLFRQGVARVRVGEHEGILQSVMREDGSGRSFNLDIRLDNGELIAVYWRAA